MRPIALECRKCGYFFSPIKIPKSHIRRGKLIFDTRCPRCRARSKFLRKITTKDIKVLLGFYKKEPWDLKTMEIALQLKEKEGKKYQSLDDIPPNLIKTFLNSSGYNTDPKKTILWLQRSGFRKEGYDYQDAYAISDLLHQKFGVHWKMPKYTESKPIEEPEPEPIKEPLEEPEPLYRYCMWIIRGCIHPGKSLSKDGTKCIKNNLEDSCLLLPDEESQ